MPAKTEKHLRNADWKSSHSSTKDGERDVLLTVKDVATLDRCSEKTVRRAIEAGRLRVIRIGVNGRLIRIRKSDHAAYRSAFGY